jgi:xanthine dehydrogenase accessory factor
MSSQFSSHDPLAAVADLRAREVPFVMATVVRAVSPTSAKPGDKLVFTRSGVVAGWVGGSCAEPIVRREAEAALDDGQCRLLHITPDADSQVGREGLSVHKMECYSGGALEIYIEPYLPLPSLLVFGNSPVASALCELGRVMEYRVTVVDLGDRPPISDEDEVVRDLEDLRVPAPASTFAVVASHGVFDEESLEKVLSWDLPYVGLVTSPRRRDQVFAALTARGVPAERLARVTAPAGLALGGRQPLEIALAVMAQIVSARRQAPAARTEAESEASRTLQPSPQPPRSRLPVAVPLQVAVAPQDEAPALPMAKSCCHGHSGT